MAAAVVAVPSPVVTSTCEPLSAAAVGAGAIELEPSAIGTLPPPPPSSGLSTAKVPGTIYPNTASAAIIINNNIINTTRGLKPNSSSTSTNTNAVTSIPITSTTTTTDSSFSSASSPITTSSVNYENTCERKTGKRSTITPNITGTTNSATRNRNVITKNTSSVTDYTADDGTAEIIANTTTCPDSIPSITTTTTTKVGIRATTTTAETASPPPPPSAPTIAATTTTTVITTSILTTSVVVSRNNGSRNSPCNNNNNSGTNSCTSNNQSSISTKTTTTNSTSIISATLKANDIISGFPSLDFNGRSTATPRIITNGTEDVRLRKSEPIVSPNTTMGPEEDGYPEEVVSNPNDGTSVIIVPNITSSKIPPSTAISTNVLGTIAKPNTTDSRRKAQKNNCIGRNDSEKTTNTKHKSNNEHIHNNNNNKNNNNVERSGLNIKNTTNCIKTGDKISNININNNDSPLSEDNNHCTVNTTCHDADNTLRVADRSASCINDSFDQSTRNIRKHDKQHINDDVNDDGSLESTTGDSDFDSRKNGIDSFDCQPRATTPSNNNNNNSGSSCNNIIGCGDSSSIVSTSITSTCATNSTIDSSNTTGNNSFSESVITNGISVSPLSTSGNSIIVPTFRRKSKDSGVTKNHTNTNHISDLEIDTKDVTKHTPENQRLSKLKVAVKNGSNATHSVHFSNNGFSPRTRTPEHSQDNKPLRVGEEGDTDHTQEPHRIPRSHQDHRTTKARTTTTPPSEKIHRTPSPPSILAPPPPPSNTTTTTRKNKRKLSEPRKRTDFSIKRFCSDVNDEEDANYEEEDFAPERKGTSLRFGEISGVDTEKNRIRLKDEVLYDRVELDGAHQPLLLSPHALSSSRHLLTQLGHPSTTRALLDTDMYFRAMGRLTPPGSVGQTLLESMRGDGCSPSPHTPLALYHRRSREDQANDDDDDDDEDDDEDDDNDDDDDADDGDDEVEDLDEDLIDPNDDEELGAADEASASSHLRSLRVPHPHRRRHHRHPPADGVGVVASRDEAGNLQRTSSRGTANRTGTSRTHTFSRRPVSSTAVSTSNRNETVSVVGRDPSVNAPIPTAHTAAAPAAAVVVPGSLSPLSSIAPPPPHLPLTPQLNGYVHHHHPQLHSHHHIIHGAGGGVEGIVGGFKSSSSGGVELELGLNSGGGSSGGSSGGGGKKPRKNYKNMTRERRIEANARERSRVHTISAAFENLRRAVPSYSCNQKLSKLAILRIACCYILALARLADMDYSEEQSAMTFDDCVELCTKTIQTEGRARRRH